MENNKLVYLHKDIDGIVRYVGSGTKHRANTTHVNSGRGKKYAEYVKLNGKLVVEIVASDLTKLEAEHLERELYHKYIDTILNCNVPSSAKRMTKEMFDKYLYYDETSSTYLRWKIDVSNRMKANSEAGSVGKSDGYYVLMFKGTIYKNHRIIAVLHGLDIEGKVIDHIDRDRSNNNINNLRVVSHRENMQNITKCSLRSDNSSGVQGVSYEEQKLRWTVTWYENKKHKAKYFPINNYLSSDDAFKAAVEYRKLMVELYYILN